MQLPNYVGGYGNGAAKLMIVAEAPGYYEDQEGKPLVGPTGKYVNEMLETAGMRRSEVYCTNVVKHRPPNNDLKRLHEIGKKVEDYIEQLWQEIRAVDPNVIVPMGALSLEVLCGKSGKGNGIGTWRGSIIQTVQGLPKCVPTIHPAALFKAKGVKGGGGALPWRTKLYIQSDIDRAVEEAKSKDLNLPKRLLQVCRNSAQLFRFLESNSGNSLVSVDIEVINTIPVCIALAFSADHAMSIPLMNFGDVNIPMADLAIIWQTLSELLSNPKIKVIGQNYKFDDEKLRACGVYSNLFADTMLLGHTVHPEFPKSLEFLTSIYTREPFYKNEGREFVLGRDKTDQLFIYNARDAAVTFEVYERLMECAEQYGVKDFFFDFVMPLHSLYMDIEREGFKVNHERRLELWDKYSEWEKKEEQELFSLINSPINIQSPKQVGLLLYKELKFPFRKSTDEDTLVSLLNNFATRDRKKKRVLELILNLRRIKKTKNTYINSPTDFDGRMRTSYRIVGTETGRTATSKLEPPVRPWVWVRTRNKTTGKLEWKKKGIGLSFHNMTKHGDIGADLRSMFEADEGETFVEVDLSQAEARVVALLANDEALLKLFDTTDIHKLTASWFFGIPPDKISKEERFIGKIGRHGGNYDMQEKRLHSEIMTNARRFHIDVNVSIWKCKQILEIFHKFSPKIRGEFHEGVRQTLFDNGMVLTSPHGRRRQFCERPDNDLFKEAYAFIPQAVVSDHCKETLVRLHRRFPSLRILVEAHDAGVFSIKDELVADFMPVLREEFNRPIDFAKCSLRRGVLTIPCEAKVGKNYKDLKDYKFDKAA